MHQIVENLRSVNPQNPQRQRRATISGQNIARAKRTKKERAELAAAIAAGDVTVIRLTLAQAARMLGVSSTYASAVRP
jgi:hypothetical protein